MRAVLQARPDSQPQRRVAGLSLLLRAVLELQAAGVTAIVAGTEALGSEFATAVKDPRVRIPLHVGLDRLDEEELVLVHDLEVIVARELLHALTQVETATVSGGEVDPHGPKVLRAGFLQEDEILPKLDTSFWAIDLRVSGAESRARKHLFQACRKPVDGLVSRHLNRYISLTISRVLVDTPVRPNTMTVITFATAVLASWMAVKADYVSVAWAGALMQLNSILDGCDGELARVRHQGSTLGQWLDTVGDDLSNVIFWAALGYGARSMPVYGEWYFFAGILAAAANMGAGLCNYAVLYRIGSGDFYALDEGKARTEPTRLDTAIAAISLLFKQDFFLFATMLLALCGWLHQSLPVVALGAAITLANSATRAWKFFALQRSKGTD